MNSVFPPCETAVQPSLPCDSARSAPAGSKRVLVLDDDAATRRLIALLLARAGYTVDLSEDGEMGWDALRCAHYDLLVTDNDMPRLNGLQLTQRLRFAGMKLPVIIASGSIELGEAEDYGWLELTAILHKPFHLAELIATEIGRAHV